MKILWFTWKDLTHPLAGGAELVNEELAKRLVADGHEVTFVVGGYKGCKAKGTHKLGYKIIRLGNRYTVYWKAYRYYKEHLQGWPDLVIDEVNTMPFFAKYYIKEPQIMFIHMLCRQIWFYQLPQPLSTVGYLIEPLYLKLLSNEKVITVSESTKQDLMRFGFNPDAITIISEGTNAPTINRLPSISQKANAPTILSFGAIKPMKRTMDQLRAFELAKQKIPDLQFWLAGDSNSYYGRKVLRAVQNSRYSSDITYHGRVSEKDKWELFKLSHCLIVTSVKEGWCLVVTEANNFGTPAVVYDADGLRDSVINGQTGLITKRNNSQQLATGIIKLFLDQKYYTVLRRAAKERSNNITFDRSYQQFKWIINV